MVEYGRGRFRRRERENEWPSVVVSAAITVLVFAFAFGSMVSSPVLSNRARPTADQVAIIRFPTPKCDRRRLRSNDLRQETPWNPRAGRRNPSRCRTSLHQLLRFHRSLLQSHRQPGCRFLRARIPEVRTPRGATARAVRPCQGDQGKAHRSSRPEFPSPIARRTLHSFVTRS